MNCDLRKLKIKVKSLAEESRIIRHEIDKVPRRHDEDGNLRCDSAHCINTLAHHRTYRVRKESRDALLAYGYLRGRSYSEIEAKYYEEPNWTNVERIANAFSDYETRNPRSFNDFRCDGLKCKASRKDTAAA